MHNVSKNKVHQFTALFLLAVFFSTFLDKPAHVLFVHHEPTEIIHTHSNQTAFSNYHNNDCPICDFEFCSFVSANQTNLQNIPGFFAEKLTPRTIDCLINQASHHFQLRAPPEF